MSDKLTKKELRAPDAFQRVGGEARAWMEDKQKFLVFGVVGILIIGAVAAVFGYVGQKKGNLEKEVLGEGLKVVSRTVEGQTDAPALRPGDPTPFKTAKEKDEAVVKDLGELAGKLKEAELKAVTALPVAASQYRLGQYEPAAAAAEQYAGNAKADEAMKASALELSGYSYEAKGDLDKALSAFERLSQENKTEFLLGMGMYHRARILYLQGKKDDAAKGFDEVVNAHPDTAAARMSKERLALLLREGVKPPAAVPVAAGKDAG